MTASSTRPLESTTWTTDSGASEIAPTCRIQASRPTNMPTANQRWLHSERAVRSGWRMSTSHAQQAPRCLYKKDRFDAKAQSSARRMPS